MSRAYSPEQKKVHWRVKKLAFVKTETTRNGNTYHSYKAYIDTGKDTIIVEVNLDKSYDVKNRRGDEKEAYFGSAVCLPSRKRY